MRESTASGAPHVTIERSTGLPMKPEVITMGRVSVDLYPEQIGVTLAEVETFAKSLGGSATNVAVAAARLGHPSALITKAGDDGFGQYIRSALGGFGVDTTWVSTDPELRTPLAFCEIHPPDDFPILFYREPKAPDMNLTVEDLDFDAITAVPCSGSPVPASPTSRVVRRPSQHSSTGPRASRSSTSTTGRRSGPRKRRRPTTIGRRCGTPRWPSATRPRSR